jgi:hypothetical protein
LLGRSNENAFKTKAQGKGIGGFGKKAIELKVWGVGCGVRSWVERVGRFVVVGGNWKIESKRVKR